MVRPRRFPVDTRGHIAVPAGQGIINDAALEALRFVPGSTIEKKRVAFYSIEMMLPEIAGRFKDNEEISKDVADRIEINEEIVSADEIISDAARMDNLGLELVDFGDLMVKGEVSEGKMSEIYILP